MSLPGSPSSPGGSSDSVASVTGDDDTCEDFGDTSVGWTLAELASMASHPDPHNGDAMLARGMLSLMGMRVVNTGHGHSLVGFPPSD